MDPPADDPQLDPARSADVLAFLRAGAQLPRRRVVVVVSDDAEPKLSAELADALAPAPSSSPAPSPAQSGSKRRGSASSVDSLGSTTKAMASAKMGDSDDAKTGSGSDSDVVLVPLVKRRRSVTPRRRAGLRDALTANKIKEETRASDEPSAGYGIVAKLVYGDEKKWNVVQYDVIDHMRKNWGEYEWLLNTGPDGANPPAGGNYSSMEAYLRFMPNAVIDNAEIQAIQRIYNLHLDLVRYNAGELTPDNHLLIPVDDYLRKTAHPPRHWPLLRVAKTGFGTWALKSVLSKHAVVRDAPVSGSRNSTLKTRVAAEGFTILIEEGDGNCQFRAIARRQYDNPEAHMRVRGEIIAYMRDNRDDFVPNMAELAVRPAERVDDEDAAFDAYLTRMERNGQWGDNATLLAATRRFGFGAIVYRARDMTRINVGDLDQPGAPMPMRVLFHEFGAAGGHYDTLEQAPEPVPMPVLVPGVRLAPVRQVVPGSDRDPDQDIAQRHHNLEEAREIAARRAETAHTAVEATRNFEALLEMPIMLSEDEGQTDVHEALTLDAAQPFNGGLNNGLMPDPPSPAPVQQLEPASLVQGQSEPPSGFNPINEDDHEL